ncbi:MAG: hypothetical protein Q4G34_01130 [Micrococcus sp.]|nr:hypothetical protein [Micrococcus sp.]
MISPMNLALAAWTKMAHLAQAYAAPAIHPAAPPAPDGGGDVENPFSGITPSFSFGDDFDTMWTTLFAAFWGLLIVITGAFLLYHIAGLASGTESNNPHEVQQTKKRVIIAAAALVAQIAFTTIVGVFFFLL